MFPRRNREPDNAAILLQAFFNINMLVSLLRAVAIQFGREGKMRRIKPHPLPPHMMHALKDRRNYRRHSATHHPKNKPAKSAKTLQII